MWQPCFSTVRSLLHSVRSTGGSGSGAIPTGFEVPEDPDTPEALEALEAPEALEALEALEAVELLVSYSMRPELRSRTLAVVWAAGSRGGCGGCPRPLPIIGAVVEPWLLLLPEL